MEYIDFDSLEKLKEAIRADYQAKKPFHYAMFDNFFKTGAVEAIYNEYPTISDGVWDGTTYIDQKNKFQKNVFDRNSVFEHVFKELNSAEFVAWLVDVTGIRDLVADPELFGGGLHQSTKGAFLNVHIDYNVHPKTKYHRRLNVLLYMNPDWKEEYEGFLELWDLRAGKKELLAKYAPTLNRCVIFETNEVSFHGHPKPLKTPEGVNRKSIATYYYTRDRMDAEIAPEHNTVFVNTEGWRGTVNRLGAAIRAAVERIFK